MTDKKKLRSWQRKADRLWHRLHSLAIETDEGPIHDAFLNAAMELDDVRGELKSALTPQERKGAKNAK